MEEHQELHQLPRVSLRTSPFLPNDTKGISKDAFLTELHGFSKAREKLPSFCRQSLDVLSSPMSAMEYLSHSWSPPGSDFLHNSSSNNLFLLADGFLEKNQEAETSTSSSAEDPEQKPEMKEMIWTSFPSAHSSSINGMWSHSQNGENIMKRVISTKLRWRNWFGGKPVISFQWLSNGRRKEELRLHNASVDAALSVVRLATAIASITRTNDMNCRKDSIVTMGCSSSMSDVISSAATLVAAVCAEAAESVGAPRDLVSSAVNSGFAAQMPADVIDLTVSAATCLRGAATLRSRTTVGCRPQEAEVLLNSRTPLPIVMPTGERKQRVVSIKLQKMRLLLIFARKYMGAVLASKQYTIVGAMEGAREARECHCIVLRTDRGDMKLMFEEEKESRIWTSTVFQFLCNK